MTDKKVVLLTGCSDGGLGSALALVLHRTKRFRVIATARNLNKLSATRAVGIEEIELDVVSDSSIAAATKALESLTNGRLDMLINNAGGPYSMPAVDLDIAKAKELFDLNVWSLITLSRAFLPYLLKSKGTIVNHISVAAYVNLPCNGAYTASKAAANALTESMRFELQPFGIRVIALITGAVASNITQHEGESLPQDSIYRVVPGGLTIMKDIASTGTQMDSMKWAEQVVGDLMKAKPPHQIWRGNDATLVRYISMLPTGTFDGLVTKRTKFDEVGKALAERKKTE